MGAIRDIAVDGIDIAEAIRIIEDEEVLEAMLRTYCEDGENKLSAIEEALRGGNIDDYAIHVHALKSSSKSIGAMGLSERFRQLELAGKGGDRAFIAENNDSTIEEYKGTLEGLKAFFSDMPSAGAIFTEEDAKPLLEAIRSRDMDECLSVLELLMGRDYSSYVAGNLEDIKTAVEIRDFEDAEALLEDVLLTIEVSGL